ncbi:S-adenosyl-L-methionine-dependent methyltransferase [Daedalea quercina L-15889]|uniref:S-adenosyl-L-methionine-dependent methyltransferase n=1 Tax=Daedalea quercina L-15889 TaxID=1314783 RepID=A0A165NL76_9APHY|nr:S-adenosyl-L-methionine-dependent methyltransferase [Daedalea quercina L-15889]
MSGQAEVRALLSIIQQATQDALAAYASKGEDVPSLSSAKEQSVFSNADNIALRRAVRSLEGACEQLCATLAPPGQSIVDRAQIVVSNCLRVVVQAGVADVLDGHPEGMHVKDLAPLVKIDEGKLSRIMRTLTAHYCFQEVDVDTFANNRLSVALLKSCPIANIADLMATESAKGGNVLLENLTDPRFGGSHDPAKAAIMYAVLGPEHEKVDVYEWFHTVPEREQNFNLAMTGLGTLMGSLTSLEGLPWDKISTVADIGGGVGAYAMSLIRQNANLNYTLCDMPAAINHAKQLWAEKYPEAVQSGRIAFSNYNFFEQVAPADQDIYYMRSVLHNWTDEQALIILKNIRAAMKKTSRVLIHDYLIQSSARVKSVTSQEQLGVDTAPEPMLPNFGSGKKRAFNMDIVMLICCNSRERTLPDMIELGRRAGLKFVKVWDLVETSIVEFQSD